MLKKLNIGCYSYQVKIKFMAVFVLTVIFKDRCDGRPTSALLVSDECLLLLLLARLINRQDVVFDE